MHINMAHIHQGVAAWRGSLPQTMGRGDHDFHVLLLVLQS